jgi:metallophosphoesterase (TIGR00282 family)
MFRILFLGDIVGKLGRKAVSAKLAVLKEKYDPDVTIANAENLTHGAGISLSALREMDEAGIDAFTSGNHVWTNVGGAALLDDPSWSRRLIRPANMRRGEPGNGSVVYTAKNGIKILLVNLCGRLAMPDDEVIENPFFALDTILAAHAADNPDLTFVDFHAELTAEKEALAHYADGRVTALIGTHTHVQTSDAVVLKGGTAYCTDAGRTGAADSVLGFEKKSAIKRFLTGEKTPYLIPERGKAEMDGVLVHADPDTGKASRIDSFREFVVIE